MKILFVAPVDVPHIGLETYFINALRKNGETVVRYGYNERSLGSVSARVNIQSGFVSALKRLARKTLPAGVIHRFDTRKKSDLFDVLARETPDAVFVFSKMIPPGVIQEARQKFPQSLFVGFAVDDPQDFSTSSTQGPHYQLFFSDDLYSTGKHSELGAHCCWLPFASDPDLLSRVNVSAEDRKRYASDVVFIGSMYPERIELFLALQDFDLAIWGPEAGFTREARPLQRFYRGLASEEEMRKIYSCSKILVNPQWGYGKNVERGSWVNLRLFEAACCGIFQISDLKKEMEQLYRIGDEIAIFENPEDLRTKINYYLGHEKERETIAARSRETTLSRHLYTHRMREVIQKCKEVR